MIFDIVISNNSSELIYLTNVLLNSVIDLLFTILLFKMTQYKPTLGIAIFLFILTCIKI